VLVSRRQPSASVRAIANMGIRLQDPKPNGRAQATRERVRAPQSRRDSRQSVGSARRTITVFFETYEVPETLIMAALALIYVGLSFVDGESIQFLGQDRVQVLIYVITAVFIAEFSIRLYAAESPLTYLRHHLFDLLAVLPTLQFLRIFGLARLVVLLRLLRIVRVGVVAHGLINANQALGKWKRLSRRSGLTSLLMISFGFLWIGADLAYQFEHGINQQFNSFGDSLWWAFSTMATLGYSTGPVTLLGRMVAGVLMILGIACFGLITATATTFFLQRTEKAKDYSTADLMEAIRGIEFRLSSLEEKLTERARL